LTTEPAHITHAKRLLTEAIQRRTENREYSGEKPTGVVCLSDIQRAEAALAAAQEDLREYQRGDDHMFETLNAAGGKGLAVGELRAEMLQQKQDKVAKRHRELNATIRAWLAGTEE
jgi:hypothetical protein